MIDYHFNRSITPEVIDKAVELWVTMLRDPVYDAIGNTGTEEEKHRMGMSSRLASRLPKNNTTEVLAKFANELRLRLLDESKPLYARSCLCVDYQPDLILAEAAKAAGLVMEFPWKTRMYLGGNVLSLSYGYGAEPVYHYLLDDGSWLVTALSGADITKVIDYIKGGKPEFVVEKPKV